MRKRLMSVPAAALMVLGGQMHAQENYTLEKVEVQGMAQTLEERKENSIAKRIIKSEEVAKYGDLNALEILKRLPGVTIPEGKKIKGAPGKGYTVVLIDGDETSTGSSRRASPLEQITPDMIDRIEIMTNGSAEYTAESMGGIVNIIIKKPTSEGRTTLKLTGGAYGSAPTATLFGQREGKEGKLGYLLNMSLSESRKEDRMTLQTLTPTGRSDRTREEELRDQWMTLNAKLNYAVSPKTKYSYDGSLSLSQSRMDSDDRTHNDGSVTPDRLLNEWDRSKGVMLWSKVRGEHHLSGTEVLDWKLKFHQNDQNGDTESRQIVPLVTSKTQRDDSMFRIFGAEGAYSVAKGNHFIKTGAELKRASQTTDLRFEGTNLTTLPVRVSMQEDKGSLYVQDEITFGEKMTVTPGVRFEKVSRDFGGNADFAYGAPSLHLLYKFTPEDHLRASVARTVKLPRLNEMAPTIQSSLDQNDLRYPDRTGNPNLKEESALSYELRYEHFFGDKGIVGIGTFYRTISDKIENLITYEQSPLTNTYRYVQRPYNGGEGELWGLELEFKKPLLWQGLNVTANATLQDSRLKESGTVQTRPIRQTSNVLGNLALDYTDTPNRMTYGAAYRYIGGYDDPVDRYGFARSLKGYGYLDLYANKRLNDTFKVGVNLKNITRTSIETTSQSYDTLTGAWLATQNDREYSRSQVLLTLEGKW